MAKWILPSEKDLKQEYFVEVELKGNKHLFPTFEDFLFAIENGKVELLTTASDRKIGYRSRTSTREELLNLIRGYKSYPKFRNEETIDNLYYRIKNDKSMTMPIVLQFENGSRRILSGNTRLDVAFQLKKQPKVLVINA